jgi:hypothetical protein
MDLRKLASARTERGRNGHPGVSPPDRTQVTYSAQGTRQRAVDALDLGHESKSS